MASRPDSPVRQGAATSLQKASLAYLAVILLAISLVTNVAAQIIVRRIRRKIGQAVGVGAAQPPAVRQRTFQAAEADRTDHGDHRHRGCAAGCCGARDRDPDHREARVPGAERFLLHRERRALWTDRRRIANAIVGTAIITGIATAIALPAGVLLAIFTTEFAPRRLADAIGLTLNNLAGVPTIVIGVFIFGLVVVGNGQSAFAGALGLSIVMLPLVRAPPKGVSVVPPSLREAAMALGATRTRIVFTVILPAAVGGIVTATIVAIARAAGETAPLLFTCSIFVSTTIATDPSHAMASIPIVIFTYSEQPDPHAQEQAWAAALVLVGFVLLVSIVGRALSARARRQIEQSR